MPSPVIVPELIVALFAKAEHDDDWVNPYRTLPEAAKMILVPDVVGTPATAEIEEVGEEEVVHSIGVVEVLFTLLTTLTTPLLVPTTIPGTDEETKVFNAVTPFEPFAEVVEPEQRVRPLVVVVAKQSAGLPLDVMRDPA